MPQNKGRLYLALYHRTGEEHLSDNEKGYFWTFVIGPKKITATTELTWYDMEWDDTPSTWSCPPWGSGATLSEHKASAIGHPLLLVAIAKIVDGSHLRQIIAATTPWTGDDPRRRYERYYDITWFKMVLSDIRRYPGSVGTSSLMWRNIRSIVLRWAQNEIDNKRFDEEVEEVVDGRIPVYDLLEED